MVSGKCAKPDESDIKLVVKYAHEKLDSKHVKDKKFDDLEFNLLIAGELEIVDKHTCDPEEKIARVQLAKTLCYHKKYLNDADLREGYNTVLKQVEQGMLNWGDNLARKLHEHLDYCTNVIARDKIAQHKSMAKTDNKRSPTDRRTVANDASSNDRVIYCLEFNQGMCPQPDNHEGQFNNKKVVKFHVCRCCHRDGNFQSHKETDDSCPKKRS